MVRDHLGDTIHREGSPSFRPKARERAAGITLEPPNDRILTMCSSTLGTGRSSSSLNRGAGFRLFYAGRVLVQSQRQFGNSYPQRVVVLAGTAEPRSCLVLAAAGFGKVNCCEEVAQGKVYMDDWGKFTHWLKRLQAPTKLPCPPGQSISPVGVVRKDRRGTERSARCPVRQPFLSGACPASNRRFSDPAVSQTMDSFGNPCPTTPVRRRSHRGPGDYSVPQSETAGAYLRK
jgi:hypothetical protein